MVSINTGCVQFDEPAQESETTITPAQTRAEVYVGSYTVLPDPYALDNMQAVYDSYNMNIELEPTHLYVRFKPQNQEQLNRLEYDYQLDLYEYPLDLDIPIDEEYVDPTIPEGEFGWYYIGVETDFAFPQDIPCEIIRECYIPADDEVIQAGPLLSPGGGRGSVVDVEKAAYERLGYETESEQPLTRAGGGQYPSGHVYVTDDAENDVPVVGIRVKVNSWIKSHWAYTDSNGYFRSTTKFYQDNLNYVLVFINTTHDFIFWRVANIDGIPLFGRVKRKIGNSRYFHN